jgi:uncharacterized membrane protein
MQTTAIALVILTGLGIIFVGASYLIAPQATAKGFGFAAGPTPTTWLNIKGIRDIVSGLALLVPLAMGELNLVGWLMLVAAITPLGDAITVLRHGGSKTLAYAMHGGTAFVVALAGVLLLLT